MIVVSVAFLVVITADLALAIGKSTRANLSPPSEPAKEDQNPMANNLQSIDDVKRENMKKTIDLTSSFIENDDAIDHFASKFIKDYGSSQISKGEVKERIKKVVQFSQLVKRDLKVDTPKERFEYLVQDLTSLSHTTSTYSEFQFCNAIIKKMPDEFLATHFENITHNDMNAIMRDFGDKCTIVNSEHPFDLNPLFIDSFELCSHLPQVLKLHLSFGLPDYVESNSDHFCTYLVDVVFPSETEQPCLLIMEQMEYQYAKDRSLDHLIPYPNIVLSKNFEDTFRKVCTSSIMGNKTKDFCDASFKAITETSQEAFKEASTMTILQYTDRFCSSVNFSLPHPGNSLLEKNKSRKHGTRNAVSHAFSLAQGYRHGILDSTGKLIQSASEDLHGSLPEEHRVPVSGSLLGFKTNATGSLQWSRNARDLDDAEIQVACSGRAYSGGVGVGVSVGPIQLGGSVVHGYGNDNNADYNKDKTSTWHYASQNFGEFCVGTSAASIFDTVTEFSENDETMKEKMKAGKLWSVGIGVEYGYFKNFGNIPGFTVVSTAGAGLFIFEMSFSTIRCCPTLGTVAKGIFIDDEDCERCGAAVGMGIFIPPSGFSPDASIEACHAWEAGPRTIGQFDPSQCKHFEYMLLLDCNNGGPYSQISIHTRMSGVETLIFRGTICNQTTQEENPVQKITFRNDAKRVTLSSEDFGKTVVFQNIPFYSTRRFGLGVDSVVFRNNRPGQIVKIPSFVVTPIWRIGNIPYNIWAKSNMKFDIYPGQIYTVPAKGSKYSSFNGLFYYTPAVLGSGGDNEEITVEMKDKCEGWGLGQKDCCDLGCHWNGLPRTLCATNSGGNKAVCEADLGLEIEIKYPNYGCSLEVKNLGVFTSPDACASVAKGDTECIQNLFMWSTAYPAWGCRCCASGDHYSISNNNWNVYAFTEIIHENHGCGQTGKNLGGFTSAHECAAKVKGDTECGQNVFMWSKTYPSWGCHCCNSRDKYATSNNLWNVYAITA